MGQAKQRGTYEYRKEVAIEKRKVAEAIRQKKLQELEQRREHDMKMARARMQGERIVIGSSSAVNQFDLSKPGGVNALRDQLLAVQSIPSMALEDKPCMVVVDAADMNIADDGQKVIEAARHNIHLAVVAGAPK